MRNITLEMWISYIAYTFNFIAVIFCAYKYIDHTYIKKGRAINYVDNWIVLVLFMKFIELALESVPIFNKLTYQNNDFFQMLVDLPAFRILFLGARLLFLTFITMFILKSPRKITHYKLNKLFTFLSIFISSIYPIFCVFFYSYRIPTIKLYLIKQSLINVLVGFPIIQLYILISFGVIIIINMSINILRIMTKSILFKAETLIIAIMAALSIINNQVSSTGNHTLYYFIYSIYLIFNTDLFIRIGFIIERNQEFNDDRFSIK